MRWNLEGRFKIPGRGGGGVDTLLLFTLSTNKIRRLGSGLYQNTQGGPGFIPKYKGWPLDFIKALRLGPRLHQNTQVGPRITLKYYG